VFGIVTAKRSARRRRQFGKGQADDGRTRSGWGLEHINIDDRKLKALGATGFMQALKLFVPRTTRGGS